MAKKAKTGGKGQRKYGRSKRKDAAKGTPFSLFVRGKITGEEYFKQKNQASKV